MKITLIGYCYSGGFESGYETTHAISAVDFADIKQYVVNWITEHYNNNIEYDVDVHVKQCEGMSSLQEQQIEDLVTEVCYAIHECQFRENDHKKVSEKLALSSYWLKTMKMQEAHHQNTIIQCKQLLTDIENYITIAKDKLAKIQTELGIK